MSTVQATIPQQDPNAYIAPVPPIGLSIQWYEHGNTSAQPWPAVVTAIQNHGTIDILITRRDGSRKTIRGAWYIDDPALQKADHYMRGVRGCWGYLPGQYVDMRLPETSTIAKIEAKLQDVAERLDKLLNPPQTDKPGPNIEARILDCATEHPDWNSVQIAEEIGTTHQRVSAILRNRPAVQKE